MEDLLNVINGSEPAKKTDFIQAGDSLIREFSPQLKNINSVEFQNAGTPAKQH